MGFNKKMTIASLLIIVFPAFFMIGFTARATWAVIVGVVCLLVLVGVMLIPDSKLAASNAGKRATAPCSVCGGAAFSVGKVTAGRFVLQGESYRLEARRCVQCGHVELFTEG